MSLLAQPFPVRVVGDERLELWDELGVPAAGELGVAPQLEGGETSLVQRGAVALGDRLAGQVGERRATPEPERCPGQLGGPRRGAVPERAPRVLDEGLEPFVVELARLDVQQVARTAGLDPPVPERAPQAVHVDLERRDRGVGRPGGPDRVDEPLAGDDVVPVQQQRDEQRALLRGAERDRATLDDDLDRSENAELRTCPPAA